ncbi:MAG: J domain-containing protein [Halorhabdus sp.]
MTRTFYDVLGVAPDADPETIEAAYRDRLKDTHPDVNDEAAATDAVKAVIEAGGVLTDDAERERYDRLGHETYVAVADAYDPDGETDAGDSRAKTASPDRNGGTRQRAATGETTTTEDRRYTGRGGSTGTGRQTRQRAATEHAGAAGTDTTDADRQRSASSGDVHTANANPEGVAWATGDGTEHPYDGRARHRSVATTSEGTVLFLAAFVAYPILVFASIYPEFLLPFRVIVGACTIGLVIYLVSVPRVSAPAFGLLSLLAGAAIYLTGIPIPSVASVGAAVVTVVPFGLATGTYLLDW